jgi:polyisoprenoid-binding protein YceI
VATYPTITFHADGLVFNGAKVIGATGTITMKGGTNPVAFQVHGFQCNRSARAGRRICRGKVTGTVKRSDFGMIKYLQEVSDEI